ncbi:hypothetical protein GCM10009768_08300 [Leucobacter iarius]|uniref:EfeO-type cupredoxin-like domain-containing protein n=1 Tax=Leucobacter iarius TaxID=333963 RepID=A0ABN2LA98_9MICO
MSGAVRTRRPAANAVLGRRALLGGALGLVGVGAAALVGCTPAKPKFVPSEDGVQAAVTVKVVDNAYEPAEVSIAPGQAVRWEFIGPDQHDVIQSDGEFASKLQREGSYTHRFAKAGDYAYLCSIHPEMKGVVHVTAA